MEYIVMLSENLVTMLKEKVIETKLRNFLDIVEPEER